MTQRLPFGNEIVRVFFKFQHELKLYHWQTFSYARHKASDKLFAKLVELIDEFVETYMGCQNQRVQLHRPLVIRSFTDATIIRCLHQFRAFLTDMESHLPRRGSTDLLNIRDEILGAVDQTLYLFTLR